MPRSASPPGARGRAGLLGEPAVGRLPGDPERLGHRADLQPLLLPGGQQLPLAAAQLLDAVSDLPHLLEQRLGLRAGAGPAAPNARSRVAAHLVSVPALAALRVGIRKRLGRLAARDIA